MKETKNYQVNRQEETKVVDISNDVYDEEEEDCEQVVVFNENEKDKIAVAFMYIVSIIAASSIFGLIMFAVRTTNVSSFMVISIITGFLVIGIFGAVAEYVKSRIGVK